MKGENKINNEMPVKVVMQLIDNGIITEETEIAHFKDRKWAELFSNTFQENYGSHNVRLYIFGE